MGIFPSAAHDRSVACAYAEDIRRLSDFDVLSQFFHVSPRSTSKAEDLGKVYRTFKPPGSRPVMKRGLSCDPALGFSNRGEWADRKRQG